jgi:ferritin-like metal-binding protein YciE
MEGKASGRENGKRRSLLIEFFIRELREIYGAEKLLTLALPRLQEATTSPDLAMAFEDHSQVTQVQIERLEQIFDLLGVEADATKCQGMEGLVKEADRMIKATEEGSFTRDVGLIVATQKVEHYEIAAYGTLRQLAEQMGSTEVTELLEDTLIEEKKADMLLSNLAEILIADEARLEVGE